MTLAAEYPDGRRAVGRQGGWDDEDEETPVLRMAEFSGTDTKRDTRYWLAPLPASGDVTIVFSWPYRGISETRTVISAFTLADARQRGPEVWPYEPEPEP